MATKKHSRKSKPKVRRRRGLGLPPEAHIPPRDEALESARRLLRGSPNCASATAALVAVGEARAHQHSAGRPLREITPYMHDAQATAARVCGCKR